MTSTVLHAFSCVYIVMFTALGWLWPAVASCGQWEPHPHVSLGTAPRCRSFCGCGNQLVGFAISLFSEKMVTLASRSDAVKTCWAIWKAEYAESSTSLRNQDVWKPFKANICADLTWFDALHGIWGCWTTGPVFFCPSLGAVPCQFQCSKVQLPLSRPRQIPSD